MKLDCKSISLTKDYHTRVPFGKEIDDHSVDYILRIITK